MTLLDGRALAAGIRSALAAEAERFLSRAGRPPTLAALLVGDHKASKLYVRRKASACRAVGMRARELELPEETPEGAVLREIGRLNRDPDVHGIIVELPLPKHVSPVRVQEAIDPLKDVDGFHPINVGRLWTGVEGFVPCTPLAILRLLAEYRIPLRGAQAVVVGRSPVVGRPMAQLLVRRDATVTLCHSRTVDLPSICRRADILIAAIGRREMIRGDWVKPGSAVVDVGINRREDGTLVGDVAFAEASQRAGWITPVPGGVGPLTIAMLLSNTLRAAERSESGR